jgi:hypothetical protein
MLKEIQVLPEIIVLKMAYNGLKYAGMGAIILRVKNNVGL